LDEHFHAALAGHGIAAPRLLAHRLLVDCYLASADEGRQRLFIKRLRSAIPKVRRNFGREIAALRALAGQPGIPRLIAAADDADMAFHACAFVDAPTLAEAIGDGLADPAGAARALGGVAASLRALHYAGYAHRDLAPEHILLVAGGVPTIVDFGMARPLGNQVRDRLARATDVQALAMMIWEMLSGRLLFAYRAATSSDDLQRERTIIPAVLGRYPLGQVLTHCLELQSEMEPHGVVLAEERALDRLLGQLERHMEECALAAAVPVR
jgi:serine/threonine protein kinase